MKSIGSKSEMEILSESMVVPTCSSRILRNTLSTCLRYTFYPTVLSPSSACSSPSCAFHTRCLLFDHLYLAITRKMRGHFATNYGKPIMKQCLTMLHHTIGACIVLVILCRLWPLSLQVSLFS
jgi:hypothetical protein